MTAVLGRALAGVRERALAYNLRPVVEVGASGELPVALLVRLLDVAWLDPGWEARQAGAEAFEEALRGGLVEPGLLPLPALRGVGGTAGD